MGDVLGNGGKGVVYEWDGWTCSMVICWLYGVMILEVHGCGSEVNTEIQLPAVYCIERNGIYWVKRCGGGSLGPEQEGRGGGGGDWIGTRRVEGGGRGLVTDTWVVSEGGCAGAVSGDLRSAAPHTILYYPSYPILSIYAGLSIGYQLILLNSMLS